MFSNINFSNFDLTNFFNFLSTVIFLKWIFLTIIFFFCLFLVIIFNQIYSMNKVITQQASATILFLTSSLLLAVSIGLFIFVLRLQ